MDGRLTKCPHRKSELFNGLGLCGLREKDKAEDKVGKGTLSGRGGRASQTG